MQRHDISAFGPHMAVPGGYIAEPGDDAFEHRFGGASWAPIDTRATQERPTLLLTLDLRDPRLHRLRLRGADSLPLASHINCRAWEGKQVFQLDPASRVIQLVQREIDAPKSRDEEDKLLNPLPERSIRLRPMEAADQPTDEDTYTENCDRFIGGRDFIRVLGPPLWLYAVEEETCRCGRPMEYVASIGYEGERQGRSEAFIDGAPFFIGEGALYFFVCLACLRTTVVSQST